MGWPTATLPDDIAAEIGAVEGYADLPGLRMHYVAAGAGPLVLLLHGFPEYWGSWRRQISPLAAAGFRVVAPNLRGYHRTERPARGYDVATLAGDVVHLITALGYEQAAVVGHDWGGAVAWQTALRHPERVSRIAALNAPHPAAFARALRTAEQARRSWYFLLFQLPWLPEWLLGRSAGLPLLRSVRRAAVQPSTFTPRDVVRLLQVWNDGGTLTGGLNYYRGLRSLLTDPAARRPMPILQMPALLIWGTADPFLGNAMTEGNEAWAPNLEPDEVNRLLIEFLRG
ncbi:MAG: alpha/beta hydrolase [Chloroflexi bacterium]|nr:alpha/beta hydrolase [Chloroflexota bacterium]